MFDPTKYLVMICNEGGVTTPEALAERILETTYHGDITELADQLTEWRNDYEGLVRPSRSPNSTLTFHCVHSGEVATLKTFYNHLPLDVLPDTKLVVLTAETTGPLSNRWLDGDRWEYRRDAKGPWLNSKQTR